MGARAAQYSCRLPISKPIDPGRVGTGRAGRSAAASRRPRPGAAGAPPAAGLLQERCTKAPRRSVSVRHGLAGIGGHRRRPTGRRRRPVRPVSAWSAPRRAPVRRIQGRWPSQVVSGAPPGPGRSPRSHRRAASCPDAPAAALDRRSPERTAGLSARRLADSGRAWTRHCRAGGGGQEPGCLLDLFQGTPEVVVDHGQGGVLQPFGGLQGLAGEGQDLPGPSLFPARLGSRTPCHRVFHLVQDLGHVREVAQRRAVPHGEGQVKTVEAVVAPACPPSFGECLVVTQHTRIMRQRQRQRRWPGGMISHFPQY